MKDWIPGYFLSDILEERSVDNVVKNYTIHMAWDVPWRTGPTVFGANIFTGHIARNVLKGLKGSASKGVYNNSAHWLFY